MARLGPLAEERLLGFDEVADLVAAGQHRPRAQMRHRSDGAARSDLGPFQHRAGLQVDVVGDAAVAHRHPRLDNAAGADGGCALEMGTGLHGGVGSDRNAAVDVGGDGIAEADAGEHMDTVDASAQHGSGLGELRAVIDAEGFDRVIDCQGAHPMTGAARSGDHVGQIVFTLRVVAADVAQRLEHERSRKEVHAGVDLANRLLPVRGVFLFHDRGQRLAFAHDAPVTAWILQSGRQHRHRGRLLTVIIAQPRQGFGSNQGYVATQQQHISPETGQGFFGTQQRVARAELFPLCDKGEPAVGKGCFNVVSLMSDHQHQRLGTECPGRLHRVVDQRLPGQLVQDLGTR